MIEIVLWIIALSFVFCVILVFTLTLGLMWGAWREEEVKRRYEAGDYDGAYKLMYRWEKSEHRKIHGRPTK